MKKERRVSHPATDSRPSSGPASPPGCDDPIFYACLQNAPFGAIVTATEPEGRCLYLNPEFSRVTGYTSADLPTVRDWLERAYPDPDEELGLTEEPSAQDDSQWSKTSYPDSDD